MLWPRLAPIDDRALPSNTMRGGRLGDARLSPVGLRPYRFAMQRYEKLLKDANISVIICTDGQLFKLIIMNCNIGVANIENNLFV